jgi:hypothetical protein
VSLVRRWLRQHYVGLLALFVALGGTSYAASKIDTDDIARNAIVSRHVAKDALRSKDVKNIKRSDIGDRRLTGADIAPDSISGDQIDEESLEMTRVVARFNVTPNLTLGPGSNGTFELPGRWTQHANESDEFIGEATVSFPGGCAQMPALHGTTYGYVTISIQRPDGTVAAGGQVGYGGQQRMTGRLAGDGEGWVEPGVDTPRTLTGRASRTCGEPPPENPVLKNVRLTVIGRR